MIHHPDERERDAKKINLQLFLSHPDDESRSVIENVDGKNFNTI